MSEAPEQGLSPTEWRIMRIVWRRRRVTNEAILTEIAEDASPSGYRQINVHLRRMAAKGYIEVDDSRRPHEYLPRIDRASAVRKVAIQLIERELGDDPEDLAVLAEVVEERRGRTH